VKIKEGSLHIDMIDLDHILSEFELVDTFHMPPSEIFMKGLSTELEFNGMGKEAFDRIIIEVGMN